MVSMQRTLETEDNLKPCMPSSTAESAAESRGAAFSQSCRLRRRSASPAEFATAAALEGLLGRVEELELESYPRDELRELFYPREEARELFARVEKLEEEKGSRDAQFDSTVQSAVAKQCRTWLSVKAETELRSRAAWMEKVAIHVFRLGE